MRRVLPAALLAVTLLATGCGAGSSDGDGAKPRLVVSAAASLKAAFTEYGRRFPDADVSYSFAGSDVLAAQIRAGARPDVYAAANTSLPDALYAVDQIAGLPKRFASNELVLAKQAGDDSIRSLADIQRKGVRLAVGNGSVPVGTYTQRVLDYLPAAQRNAIRANVRSAEPDVTGIVGKLTQGAVDAGFLYATDVSATNGKLEAIHLPKVMQPVVEYAITIVNGTKHPAEAKAFIIGLLSGSGRDALDKEGFGLPAKALPLPIEARGN